MKTTWVSDLSRYCSYLIFTAIAGVFLFSNARFGGVVARDQAIIQMVVAGCMIVWALVLAGGRSSVPSRSLSILLLCAVAYGALCVSLAEAQYSARSDAAHFCMMIGVLLCLHSCSERKNLRRILVWAILIVAGLHGFYAIVQFFQKSVMILGVSQPLAYEGRSSGGFINPNHGAWMMSIGGLLGLPLAIFVRKSWSSRILIFYLGAVAIAGVVFTYSRGAWLGLLGSFFAFAGLMIIARKNWRLGTFSLFIAISATFMFLTLGLDSVREQGRMNSANIRVIQFWPAAIKVWKEQPIVGVGPGGFSDHYRMYRLGNSESQSDPVRVHNDYLNVLTDWGIVGLALLLFGAGLVGIKLYQNTISSNQTMGRRAEFAEAVALVLASVYLIIHGLTDFVVYIPSHGITMMIVVALILVKPGAGIRAKETNDSDLPRKLCRYGLVLISCTLGFVLWSHASSRFREANALSKAVANSTDFDVVLEQLELALEHSPKNPDTHFRIGEIYRRLGTEGAFDRAEDAEQALVWYDQSIQLNRLQPYCWISKGRTEMWLDRTDAARRSFQQAIHVDPQNYRVQAYYGWFLFEQEEYVKAYHWLKRSQWISFGENPIAKFYLDKTMWKLRGLNKWPLEGADYLKTSNPDI